MSGLRRQSETESAGDTDHTMEDIANLDEEGVAAGGEEGGRHESCPGGFSVGVDSDFLSLPSFSRFVPNSVLTFNEHDLIFKDSREKSFIQNSFETHFMQHSAGGLEGNVYQFLCLPGI